MFNAVSFTQCIQDNLKDRGFGHKRIKEITDDFTARAKGYEAQGKDAGASALMAQRDVFDYMSEAALERAKRSAKMIGLQADNIARIRQGIDAPVSKFVMDGKKGSRGTAVARAAVSLIEDDPRFNGMSYSGTKETVRGQLYALFGDTLETIGKGIMGRQKGKAHMPNIVREISGEATGDASAKAVADAWNQIQNLAVDMFNEAGGSMKRLDRYLPQSQNSVRMTKAGKRKWVADHVDNVDWNKTRWPDGTPIPADKRVAVLENVFDTLTTDGATKIDVTAFRGSSGGVGNTMDRHRFLHYKNSQAWLDVHEAYGDGNVFETLVRHIEEMSHKIATVETFGPNPEMTKMNIMSIVRSEAAKGGAEALAHADAVMKNKFDPMFETVMRENPMDPHSTFGNLVTGTANVLTAAQLGSASFLAIPGDFMQTAAVRALTTGRKGIFDGVGTYLKTMIADPKGMRSMATQSGFIMDEVVMATYAQSRFTGVSTVGPAATRQLAEATMRLSLMSGHTRAARWTVQSEYMGMMHRARGKSFQDAEFSSVMQRYGILPDEWDALRGAVQPWTPRKGAEFMRPIDILKTDLPNKQALYRKFQGMIYDEARKMVPEATVEGAVSLRSTTRPDTLVGSLMYSFSMYKNFPISFMMIYGRLGLTSPSIKGRLGFYAGLGAGMTMVGALGTQMREISKGRDPLPMDNAAFMGKAFLSGGALSIWGDFLFAGVNEYGRGPAESVAGPLVSFMGDTTDLVLGDAFQFAETVGSLSDKDFESTTAAKSVEWAKRYMPGTSIWWARLALERQVFDRLQELADPSAYQKQQRKVSNRQRDYGQGHWWAPGDTSPDRAPNFGG
jgi:hypothetical protein